MGLDFGWRVDDTRETIWKGDSALRNVDKGALEDWQRDGDASHLRPYAAAGKPEVFTFRALTLEENRFVLGATIDGELDAWLRRILYCFRIGVSFPDAPDQIQDIGGVKHSLTVRERGIRMLAEPFVAELEKKYPGIVSFYGSLISQATWPSEPEKKASSPLSTPTPSSEAATTAVDTAALNGAAQPVA